MHGSGISVNLGMADSKGDSYNWLKKLGIIALAGTIITTLISRYLNNDYKPFWEKHLSLSGVVIKRQNGRDTPAVHASVNLIFPHEGKQDYTDLEGKYAFSLTGSGRDSADIEYIVENQIRRMRIGLNYYKRKEQLDTIYFVENKIAPAWSDKTRAETGNSYFRAIGHVDMALVTSTNTSGYDFENGVSTYFQKKGMSVSTSFFRPSFVHRYEASLRNGDPSVFYALNINQYAGYVCFIDPSVSYSRSTLNDAVFVTASGRYQVVLFNLKTHNTFRTVINQRGAGSDRDEAREDLERKCIYVVPAKLGGIAL